MQEKHNSLKQNAMDGQVQIGIWCSLGSAMTTEIVAGSGCDWLLIDGEHSPNDLLSITAQLQAVGGYPVEPVVRLPSDDSDLIKQHMDAGARNLMIPNVRNVAQAKRIIAATRYAPEGVRGYSVGHRANNFGRIKDYHANAHKNQLLFLQIECAEGLKNAADIAALDGADVLFVGPGDLSTNLGAMGNPNAEHVQQAIRQVIAAAAKSGKPTGILAPVKADADRYIEAGCKLVAVGADLGLLARGSDALMTSFGKA
ncbi:2-dehydro-3-deoxyglucarate aldolase [Pseudorhodobacter turbinis]|uniref:2-dehydro-3-deoxyglucarate aldolase n=1 Tax=Pseudorhodobacter turbinis TaxID=2500533 RepID=A0A4P8EGZ5_9RHOB|nr:HpcH/HpaI aldolase/citrate lyase family protein [Pseudorhodobacter turbinis]QCO56440.1 2-dehydro-3-deoxyglucarate aldolase [Pseudorhodobacter turbinis]